MAPRDLTRLRGVVRELCDADVDGRYREAITRSNYEQLVARHNEPSTPLEQLDRLLVMIAERAQFVGAQTALKPLAAMARRLYVESDSEMPGRIRAIQEVGFGGVGEVTNERAFVTLNLAGWERADRLRKSPKVGNQAFVAMWFHPGMDALFDDGILPALKACGYAPYRVDRTLHGNKIDDEIIANLLKSRLVIADLTGMRPNVFYEAGFAMGRGIPLILSCAADYIGHFVAANPNDTDAPTPVSERWFKQVEQHAFDVRQYPVIQWSGPADLATKLKARIEAQQLTIGR